MAVFFSSSSPLIGWPNFCSRLRFIAGMATTSDSIIPPLAAVSGRLPPDRARSAEGGMGVLHIVGGQTDVRQPSARVVVAGLNRGFFQGDQILHKREGRG